MRQIDMRSDRGEVFISLGEPDEMVEQPTDVITGTVRAIRWRYVQYDLSLIFQDEDGFGRYRLTPVSRSAFVRTRNRLHNPS